MDWSKPVFALIIILLYVPLVFFGVHTFFPDRDRDQDIDRSCSFPRIQCDPEDSECNTKFTAEETLYQECLHENQARWDQYNDERQHLNSWKYITILLFNIIILLSVQIIQMSESVRYGLFFGAVIAGFIATLAFFESRSIPAFILLVIMLIITIYFVNKQKTIFTKKR